MKHRRKLLVMFVAGALAGSLASFAQPQQQKVPRIGFLISEALSGSASRVDALRAGLLDRGYVEGKNIAIELRSADGDYDRLPELAAELVKLKVDVIVAFGTKAVLAAKRATTTIPIVDPVMGDPVAAGLGSSLARPGGNITGSAQFGRESNAKRLEYLKEALPRITRVAFLFNPANPSGRQGFEALRVTADALKLELQALEVRNTKELGAAFSAMALGRVEAIVVSTDTFFQTHAIDIADLAAKQRLPSAGATAYAIAGGLIGYGVNDADMYRHAAYFVDRILKGAKPRDLPIEQATRLYLVINLETAKALGVAIPQSLLVRADEVIQ
jgi:putative ABC transport system substrate-binding protein